MSTHRMTIKRKESRRERARRVGFATRSALNAIKTASGCVDCGYNANPVALQFDHRDPAQKSFSLCQGKSKPWDVVLSEVAKCDVRCANCHAIRTVEQRHHRSTIYVAPRSDAPLFEVS